MRMDSSALLHAAVLENNPKAVYFLLKHGVDANVRAHVNNNVMHKFVKHELEMCEIFTRYRNSSLNTICTLTPNPVALPPGSCYIFSNDSSLKNQQQQQKSLAPMHIAAANGRADILKLLIYCGGDIDVEMEGDYTPLTIAILYQHYKIVEVLVNYGANVNARSRSGKTPLYFAVKTRQPAMVWLLLKHGANPNFTTNHGVTPLHIAVERKLYAIAELLLKNRADVNVKTKTGVTPLHCAAVKGQSDIIELILKYGGDVNMIMNKGEVDITPLLWVTETERRKITNLVMKYAPKSKGSGFYGHLFKKVWKHLKLKKI